MSNDNDLENATERLASALKAMEEAVASKRRGDLTIASLSEQVENLKANLESERSRNEKLSSANQEVSDRIDSLMDSINDMLQEE